MNPEFKETLKMSQDVLKDIVVPLVAVALSGIIAWSVSKWTANATLQGRLNEGQSVYSDIGYRYFHALYRLYVQSGSQAMGLSTDPEVQAGFIEVVADIRDDIRWLRASPLYGRIQVDAAILPILQNSLAELSARGSNKALSDEVILATTKLMCTTYSELLEDKAGTDIAAEVRTAARVFCERV